MEQFDKLVELLDELATKYNFEDEDVARIQEIIYGIEGGSEFYGDEYIENEEEPDNTEE